jgi:phosphate-selective porin OprO and OprP
VLTWFLPLALATACSPEAAPHCVCATVAPEARAEEQPAGQVKKDDKHADKHRDPLSWQYGDRFRLEVDGSLGEDVQGSYDGSEARGLSRFSLERNRIGVQGAVFTHIEFEVAREVETRDVEAGSREKTAWRDVNINLAYLKSAQIQVGRFKVPFGLDALTSEVRNDFVYRSLGADYLAPGRDAGVMLHGRVFDRVLHYSTGWFHGDGEHARSSKVLGGTNTFAMRLTGSPFRRVHAGGLDDLEFGAAVAVSDVSDEDARPQGLRGRTVLTEDTFFHSVYVNGQRRRVGTDVSWKDGPVSIRAEYIRVTDERLRQGYADEDLSAARYRSWYLGGTYLLTGEKKRRPIRPRHDLGRGGFGALEAVARYEHIWFDSAGGAGEPLRNPRAEAILSSGDRLVTVGFNWILNRYVTLKFNAIRESVSDPEANPSPDRGVFWNRVLRFQLAL